MLYQSLLTGIVPGLLLQVAFVAACPKAAPQYPTEDKNVIKRDVAIIGGGSSGTYMAVKLKDAGKTFVVRHQQLDHSRRLLDRPDRYGLPPPDQAAVGAALAGYAAQRAKYPALETGFNLTYPVPEDLLLPFGEFVTRYQLEALVPIAFLVSQGITPYLNVSTLYVFKNFNPLQLSQPLLTTENHNTHELYANALTELGSDVLLQTSVKEVSRANGAVRITVQTPEGTKTIEAKKVIFAAPPVLDNFAGWDLSEDETSLFGQWHASGYYTGILENAGIPAGFAQLQNSGPGKPFRLPELPGPYVFRQVDAANVTQVYYGNPDVVSPTWRTFSSHAPFNLMVSKEAIEDRFYEKVFALQGTRNTYYTGAAWTTQASNSIWEFTDQYLLPILLAAL
ncbi:FAD dependent oxidoreductase [Apiospora hydei]|uniref:FAD dependent oxidoreductase n=1 Tax=Apiospora hydei TaxID=1337664 RepID=A0ABR1WQN9_9PEZI